MRASLTRRLGPAGPPVLALALLLSVLAGSVAVAVTSSTAAAAQSGVGGSQGCSRVDVLLLMDTSASLRSTDPRDQRVAAAEVLLRSLASSAAAGGSTVDVTVAS